MENKEEFENKENIEKIIIKSIYYEHNDNYSSKKMKLLLIENGGKKYKIFQKRRVNNDIFYIPFNGGYLKIWKDKKGNVLFYVDFHKMEIFTKEIEIFTVINCNKDIEILEPLKDIAEFFDLKEQIKLLICANFEF